MPSSLGTIAIDCTSNATRKFARTTSSPTPAPNSSTTSQYSKGPRLRSTSDAFFLSASSRNLPPLRTPEPDRQKPQPAVQPVPPDTEPLLQSKISVAPTADPRSDTQATKSSCVKGSPSRVATATPLWPAAPTVGPYPESSCKPHRRRSRLARSILNETETACRVSPRSARQIKFFGASES